MPRWLRYQYDVRFGSELGCKLFVALLCCLPTATQGQFLEIPTVNVEPLSAPLTIWWLILCGVAFVLGNFLSRRRERLLQVRLAEAEMRLTTAETRLAESDRTSNTFAIAVPWLNAALEESAATNRRVQAAYEEAADNFDRMSQAYQELLDNGGGTPRPFRSAFTELNELRVLREDGVRVIRRAMDEIQYHMNVECPFYQTVLVTEECPTKWHTNHMCPLMNEDLRGEHVEVPTLQHVRPCSHRYCAERWTTPWCRDDSGDSLLTQCESWLEDAQYTTTMERWHP